MHVGVGIRSVLTNGAYLFGSNAWAAVLRAVYLVFLTRLLGPESYGIWAYAIASYIVAMTAANFGIEMLFSMRMGARKARSPRFFANGLLLRIALLGGFSLALAIYAFTAEDAGLIRTAILLAIPALWGRGLAVWARAVLTGMERSDISFRVGLFVRAAEVGIGILLLLQGFGLIWVLALHGACWIAEAMFLIRNFPTLGLRLRIRLDSRMVRHILQAGVVLGLAALFTTVLASGPIIIARRLLPDLGELGQVAIVFQMAGLLSSLAMPFLNSALPVMFRTARSGDARLRAFGPVVAVVSLLLAAVGAFAAVLVGADIVRALFGVRFDMAGEMLAPAVVVAGLMIAPIGFNHYLVVMGRRSDTLVANAIGACCLLLLSAPALTQFGAVGILIAAGVGWLVRLALMFWFAARVPRN